MNIFCFNSSLPQGNDTFNTQKVAFTDSWLVWFSFPSKPFALMRCDEELDKLNSFNNWSCTIFY